MKFNNISRMLIALNWKNFMMLSKKLKSIVSILIIYGMILYLPNLLKTTFKIDPKSNIQDIAYDPDELPTKIMTYFNSNENNTIYIQEICEESSPLMFMLKQKLAAVKFIKFASAEEIDEGIADQFIKYYIKFTEESCEADMSGRNFKIDYTVINPRLMLNARADDIYNIRLQDFSRKKEPAKSAKIYENMELIQSTIDTYIIKHDNGDYLTRGSQIRMPMSIPALGYSVMFRAMRESYTILYMLFCCTFAQAISSERGSRVKETLTSMGLERWMQWSSWYLIYTGILLLLMYPALAYTSNITYEGDEILLYGNCDISVLILIYTLVATANMSMALFVGSFFETGFPAVITTMFLMALKRVFDKEGVAHKSQLSMFLSAALPGYPSAAFSNLVKDSIFTGRRVSFSNAFEKLMPDYGYTLGHVICFLMFETIFYYLLALYVDDVRPGRYGVPKEYTYPIKPLLKTKSKESKSTIKSKSSVKASLEKVHKDLQKGIVISNLVKKFAGADRLAVNELNLTMYKNQITVLLGHNGAGKTCTMFMMTGFLKPTSGDIVINGESVTTKLDNIRKTMSLCPQHDVLIDNLTVWEHMKFMILLSGGTDKEIMEDMLESMRMVKVKNTQACKLSGGQRRKLSIMQAIVYGKDVVILDEPTSGVDVESRQLIWQVIKKFTKGRTVLLSTHYMDEAEYLGDRVAVMADGRLLACGSPLFLKKKYGAGYKLIILKNKRKCDVNQIMQGIQYFIPTAKKVSDIGSELVVQLGNIMNNDYIKMFFKLDQSLQDLGIDSYGVSSTTLEDVFIKMHNSYHNIKTTVDKSQESVVNVGSNYGSLSSKKSSSNRNDLKSVGALHQIALQMGNKFTLHITSPLWLSIQVGFVFLGWVLGIAITPEFLGNSITGTIAMSPMYYKKYGVNYGIISDDSNPNNVHAVTLFKDYLDRKKLGYVHYGMKENVSIESSINFLMNLDNYTSILYDMACILVFDQNNTVHSVFSHNVIYSNFISINLLSNIMAINHNSTKLKDSILFTMGTGSEKYPSEEDEVDDNSGVIDNIFFFGFLGFTIFLIILKRDVDTGVKRVQFICGLRRWVYWLSNAIMDYAVMILIICINLIIFVIYDSEITYSNNFASFLILMVTYTLVTLSFIYFFSILNISTGTACVIIFLSQVFIGQIISIINSKIKDTFITDIFPYIRYVFFLSDYIGQLSRYAYYKQSYEHCTKYKCDMTVKNPVKMCGYPIFFDNESFIHAGCEYSSFSSQMNFEHGFSKHMLGYSLICIIFVIIILLIEYEVMNMLGFSENGSKQTNMDPDVEAERNAVEKIDPGNFGEINKYAIVLKGATKKYGIMKPRIVVNDIWLSVPKGQLFGLLGVNGAGKSTVFGMMTGSTNISGGRVYVNGYDISMETRKVYKNLGYCPQTDNLVDHMTCKQTLVYYAKLKGINSNNIEKEVNTLLNDLHLTKYTNVASTKLSGGNKRKLCTAISMIGDPATIFLDEPTCGMDPFARRESWKAIEKVVKSGRTVLLTSHSMEECESLCERLLIMVDGRFVCLGTPHHLKKRFGGSYLLKIQMEFDYTEESKAFLIKTLEKSVNDCVCDNSYGATLNFKLPSKGISWASMFKMMQGIKESNELKVQEYSLSQTSLEDIFTSFAKNQ